MKTETYYVKRGRRYVPAASVLPYDWEYRDRIKPGTFRLVYAYQSGGKRYEYDVTPATAAWVAAAQIARQAMEDAMLKASKAPASLWDISEAAIKAVADYRP